MSKNKSFLVILLLVLLVACQTNPTTTIAPLQPTAQSTPSMTQVDHIVISEIMAGVTGNNNYDYVELYNPTLEIVDLQGYSLWYQLNQDKGDELIYTWESPAYIPPFGHYLLLREGQDVGMVVDTYFDFSLVPQRGSLALRSRDTGLVDQVAWGDSDSTFMEVVNAPAFRNDYVLERMPGGSFGNGQDFDNNQEDFFLNKTPNPQTTASVNTPALEKILDLEVEVDNTVVPGSTLEYSITVTNPSQKMIPAINLSFPMLEKLTLVESSWDYSQSENVFQFYLGDLNAEASLDLSIVFETPWQYMTITNPGIFLEAPGLPAPVFSGPLRTEIQGGSVPIGIARTLLGSQDVIVEGTATMYTGGFYAGSGVKFYLEDTSGGIQVYVPGGSGKVDIPLGAYVRVQGEPQPYRGAIELVPSPDDITVVRQAVDPFAWESHEISVKELHADQDTLLGELVTVNGEVTRVEEFSYSYEIDLQQDGKSITFYIDKLTEMNIEFVEPGQYYQITGIVEMVDDDIQVYPRVQSDLVEMQPPTVTLDTHLPINYEPTEAFTIEFIVTNHLPQTVDEISLVAEIPSGFRLNEISSQGILESSQVLWSLDSLEGDGTEIIFSLTGTIDPGIDYLLVENFNLTYARQDEILVGNPTYSFPGDTVPVWAIQGKTNRSPYLLQKVTTTGVVTGVFPELEGFWIQGLADQDSSTSEGLFVFSTSPELPVSQGDFITVSGVIHEPHTETQLFLEEYEISASNQPLPAAVTLNPPQNEDESAQYYEAIEGMLVYIQGPVKAVSPTNKYGETALVYPLYEIDRLMQGEENGMAIRVDDGSFYTHTDQSTMSFAVSTGDYLYDIRGPLAFNYGYFKVELLTPPRLETNPIVVEALPSTGSDEFRVMTWNVENLFDFLEPHPSDPALPTVAEYRAFVEKIAKTILLADSPAIIGFQEVEHVGVLEDIAENPIISGSKYQAILIEGTDSRGIDVGYLVRGDVQVVSVEQFTAPNELTPRPPLLLEVQINLGDETRNVFVLNNHFLSMSGGEEATEPRRIAQVAWNIEIVNQIFANKPDAKIIIMGDLNSYYDSPPIDTLRAGGFYHVFDRLEPEERYTYIYQGVSQVLDHILVNEMYSDTISRVDILHVNADYPLQMPGDTSVLHKSDHDPVVVTFK